MYSSPSSTEMAWIWAFFLTDLLLLLFVSPRGSFPSCGTLWHSQEYCHGLLFNVSFPDVFSRGQSSLIYMCCSSQFFYQGLVMMPVLLAVSIIGLVVNIRFGASVFFFGVVVSSCFSFEYGRASGRGLGTRLGTKLIARRTKVKDRACAGGPYTSEGVHILQKYLDRGSKYYGGPNTTWQVTLLRFPYLIVGASAAGVCQHQQTVHCPSMRPGSFEASLVPGGFAGAPDRGLIGSQLCLSGCVCSSKVSGIINVPSPCGRDRLHRTKYIPTKKVCSILFSAVTRSRGRGSSTLLRYLPRGARKV